MTSETCVACGVPVSASRMSEEEWRESHMCITCLNGPPPGEDQLDDLFIEAARRQSGQAADLEVQPDAPSPLDLDAIEAALQHWQPTEWNRRTIRNLVAEVRELKRDLQQTDEAWTESVQEHQARIRELVAERDEAELRAQRLGRNMADVKAERDRLLSYAGPGPYTPSQVDGSKAPTWRELRDLADHNFRLYADAAAERDRLAEMVARVWEIEMAPINHGQMSPHDIEQAEGWNDALRTVRRALDEKEASNGE